MRKWHTTVAKVIHKTTLHGANDDVRVVRTGCRVQWRSGLRRLMRCVNLSWRLCRLLNKDFKEFIELLLSNEVNFLVVGAHALAMHGCPRCTGDLAIWVRPDSVNVTRSASHRFGLKPKIFRIGVPALIVSAQRH